MAPMKIPCCPLRARQRRFLPVRVAAYARYSSDQQREASLEDQLRNCRAYAKREGWPEPEPYSSRSSSDPVPMFKEQK